MICKCGSEMSYDLDNYYYECYTCEKIYQADDIAEMYEKAEQDRKRLKETITFWINKYEKAEQDKRDIWENIEVCAKFRDCKEKKCTYENCPLIKEVIK